MSSSPIPKLHEVFSRINDKGGGVYLWYMMFGQQCSIIVVI